MRVRIDDDTEVEVPVKYEVCPRCEGRGVHVDPSIDGNGLTQEDFDEDPDFEESYRSGLYDVACYECGGKRVVEVADKSRCSPEILAALERQERVEREIERDSACERRYLDWMERY